MLHVPRRIENLSQLRFDKHIHWLQGRGKPALLVFNGPETKNREPLDYELATGLADRLYAFRHDSAAPILGRVPEVVFISRNGKPRVPATLRVAIQKTVLRHLGVKLSPHQFGHIGAKLA